MDRITARLVAYIGDENAGRAPALLKRGVQGMQPRFPIFRLSKDQDTANLEQVREMLAAACQVLTNTSSTDTFAGRKTQEPFPQELPPN